MWLSFVIVATGVFMSTMDSSMVNIALPAIMDDFQTPLRSTEWVVMVYLLAITATLLIWGYLADRFGRRRVFASGMLVFALGSLACALAPQLHWLVLARLGQALGAAMMMATGPAMVKEIFPPGQLGRGLGLIGVAVSLGLMAGPAIGGFLLETFSWRAIFLVTVPVGMALSLPALRLLPADRAVGRRRFDGLGALLWLLALTLIVVALSRASAPGGGLIPELLLLAGSILALGLLIKIELLLPQPLLPLHLFRRNFFTIGMASAALSFVLLFTVLLLIPFYLDRILGLSGSRLGLVMMAIPAAVLVVAPAAGRLADRIGARLLTTAGLLLSTGGLLLLATLTPSQEPWEVAWRLAILGGGQAMFLSPNSAAVLGGMEKHYLGTAAALLATARNLGMLLGIAQAGLLFSLFFGAYSGGLELHRFSPAHTGAFMLGLHHSLLITAGIGLGGAFLSWQRATPGGSASPPGSPIK
jgi:EmrB/QacA subfamily drug resistance transporter